METRKCDCGGLMHHSSDMENPGGGEPFFQCEDCGEIVDDTAGYTYSLENASRSVHTADADEIAAFGLTAKQYVGATDLADGVEFATLYDCGEYVKAYREAAE